MVMKRRQIVRFQDLVVGDLFAFLTAPVRSSKTYKKVSARCYIDGNKKTIAGRLVNQKDLARIYEYPAPKKVKPYRVGSVNVEVERIRRT